MMNLLQKLTDNTHDPSLANKFRQKRFAYFCALIKDIPRPLSILDVGGTRLFWEQMEFADEAGVAITILNLEPEELSKTNQISGATQFHAAVGDARDMPQFTDKEFDIVFSNSVIEHVGDYSDQRKMMNEVRRVGKRYFVQTPNYFFPVEPHFHIIGFQFLPVSLRALLLQRFNLGWTKRVTDKNAARIVVESVNAIEELSPEVSLEMYGELQCGAALHELDENENEEPEDELANEKVTVLGRVA